LIPVFSASDISGINLEESKIVISSKSYSRTIKGSEMKDLLEQYNEYLEDTTKDPGNLLVTLRYNEEYKVTYTVYDNSTNKNSTTQSYTIKVGDLVAPVINVEDNIVASTQKINQNLVIDISKITLTDNETKPEDVKIKITVKNTTTGAEIKNIHEDEGKYEYAIDTAGEYTVTFKATDAVGNEKTITRTFTVNEEDNKGMETNEVIAIVACCVAVLILAGAIVYMVVTKKKIQSYK
jgi:ribulose 1,5-bisphosphate synthetase/thiazole synthase